MRDLQIDVQLPKYMGIRVGIPVTIIFVVDTFIFADVRTT